MGKSYDALVEENESLCSYMMDIAKKLKSANEMYQELISQIDIMKQEHSLLVNSLKVKQCSSVRRDVQDILFEHQNEIPEGVYLKLMNALKK